MTHLLLKAASGTLIQLMRQSKSLISDRKEQAHTCTHYFKRQNLNTKWPEDA